MSPRSGIRTPGGMGALLGKPRHGRNKLCRDGVEISELLDHLTWLGFIAAKHRVQIIMDPNKYDGGGVMLQIFQRDPVQGVAGARSLQVQGPTLFSCIGVLRTRLEKKKADLEAAGRVQSGPNITGGKVIGGEPD